MPSSPTSTIYQPLPEPPLSIQGVQLILPEGFVETDVVVSAFLDGTEKRWTLRVEVFLPAHLQISRKPPTP